MSNTALLDTTLTEIGTNQGTGTETDQFLPAYTAEAAVTLLLVPAAESFGR